MYEYKTILRGRRRDRTRCIIGCLSQRACPERYACRTKEANRKNDTTETIVKYEIREEHCTNKYMDKPT